MILRHALRVMMRHEIARSSLGVDLNEAILGCVSRAERIFSGGFSHSTPLYRPSVFCRNTTTLMSGSIIRPSSCLTKLSGFPLNVRHGRMQTSRLKCWRSPTMGL